MRRGPIVPYIPALDGMRALAVLAVIVYHANSSWLGGGFLGVEVFFVISGYLITLILIAERERVGNVQLGNFWLRRARRLLPALWTLLISITVYCALFNRDRLGMLRGDVVGGFFYISNWFQVWTGSSYTSAFAFAPLRHLWSLAVEEQYYIIWPLIMYLVLRRVRSKNLPALGLLFISLATAVAVGTAFIYHAGPIDTFQNTPGQFITIFGRHVLRVDFLYLGTFSRASGLLLGGALATMWRPWALMRGRAAQSAAGLDVVGLLGLGGLAFTCWRFREVVTGTDSGQHGYDLLYRGGFFLVGVCTVFVVMAIAHPRSILGKWIIGQPVLVWIGKRSYGLYLYHWAIFEVYRKHAGNSLKPGEFIALMAITFVVTEVSYQFIETPVRKGKLSGALQRIDSRKIVAIGIGAVLPVFAVVSMATATVKPDDITANLDANEGAVTHVPTTVSTASTVASATTLPNETSIPAVATTTIRKGAIDVLAVGDSVMLGSAKKLAAHGITVDAAKNRQVIEAAQIFNYYESVNKLGNYVVLHLGTNGTTKAATLDEVLKPLSGVAHVIVLTTHVPTKAYEKINNELINALPARYPNVQILDWYTLSKGHPEWFSGDQVHPNAVGQDAYVAAILQALGRS
jgi:peptidoglycan/LPS O-acetylase OafA/YrhL